LNPLLTTRAKRGNERTSRKIENDSSIDSFSVIGDSIKTQQVLGTKLLWNMVTLTS
jgi:hypothetical protein